ncbi:hypothetical protein ACOT81_08290 [Streptomyces sp. WI04-05B]|uniref:hypothetical protein n=1 Tax=Streptomyces TaxID=1883 RepID=UPI0029AE0C87|nr:MULTISPECIES: hypothetical protein [unclassified Streptomyces]MDX2540740.1 hypothetical protein [Streptomyces sp. WI04-05B]MDX2585857.1 hypothetical protein [Streptomyces sp. WI04-05A]MDX3746109.1 hypothetical protein [Streptomyces sp. AK08-02]
MAPLMAAAITFGFTSAAQAKPIDTIIWAFPSGSYSDNGKAYFFTDGDVIGVYDLVADHAQACVAFYAKPVSTGKRALYARCNTKGAGTVQRWDFDFVENSEVNIQAWLLDETYDYAYGPWVSTIA